MTPKFRTELTLPNAPAALDLARTYATQIVGLADLDGDGADGLVEAVVEAAANVLDHAFEPGDQGTFTVTGEITPTDVIFSVQDRGLPFDPLRHTPTDLTAAHLQGNGLAEIRRAVDRLDWVHRGREGKELRMVKHRPQRSVTDQLGDADLLPIAADAPLAPEQEYEVCLFRPEHSIGVSRCIYRVYGNTYMHEDCYYPDRLVRQNETGELVSVVALDQEGEVVGHYALERPRLTRVAERGMAVVSPNHRGRDLMGRMRVFIEEEARRLGLIGVYSVAVTVHTYSQRVNEEFGSDVCGVMIGGGPNSMLFKKIEGEKPPQRVTWVIYYTYVQPPQLSVVHAPPRHREMLQRIYAGLPVEVEFRDGGPIPEREGEVEVTYSHSMDNGTIRIRTIGEDTCAEVRQATEDLCGIAGADVVFVEIPLAQPGAPALCDLLEQEGYFFQGLGPSFSADGDALILAYLNVEMDPLQAKVANPFAQEILEYSAREMERVRGLATA